MLRTWNWKGFHRAASIVFLIVTSAFGHPAQDYAVNLTVSAHVSPPRVQLQWPGDNRAVQYHIRRKGLNENNWGLLATLGGSATEYSDTAVAVGSAFEYEVEKVSSLTGPVGQVRAYTYVYAGIEAPLADEKGKVILVVDSAIADAISGELAQFQANLIGAGWQPIVRRVNRTDSVPHVRNVIRAEYTADPARVRSVVLIGRVPVPYSGLINPDFHAGHLGAWPADVYYAEMDGNWTDSVVNKRDSEDAANNNVPGDGKFDQSEIPSVVELEIGRIDFSNLPAFAPRTEVDLLRNYFRKNHNFRHRIFTLKRQGLIRDNFGDLEGDAPAVDAWRHYPVFFEQPGSWREVGFMDFFPALDRDNYLWAYACGGGGYRKMDGTGATTDFASRDPKAAFLMLHGSYFGDWNNTDNFLRAAIATPNYTLASIWTGLPHWYMHPMGLGQTLGFSTRLTQNNRALYKSYRNFAAGQVHISLIGDPTLEMYPVAPPSNLRANVSTGITLSWDASADPVQGYHVYYSQNPNGPFSRISTTLVPGTSFLQRSLASGTHYFMTRAIKLERTGSGSFWNASQGIVLRVDKDGSTQLPVVNVTVEDGDVSEDGPNPGSFRFTRNPVTAAPLVVDYQISGTAVNGIDYDSIGSSVTIPAGVGAAFVTIMPRADTLVEGTESVTLSIKASSTYTVGSPSSGTLQIQDRVVNEPPVISAIADVTINEDGVAGPISFTISDSGTPAGSLTVQAASSNLDLVPQSGVQLGGSGGTRTITLTPRANAFGQTTITISVSDGALTTTRTFVLRVTAVNDPPVARGQTVDVIEDTPKAIVLQGEDIDSTSLVYVVTAPPTRGVLSGTPPNVIYTPNKDYFGNDSFTFTVSDGQAESAPATVQIRVLPVNDPPVISAVADIRVAKNRVGTAAFTVQDVETSAAELIVTATSSNSSVVSQNGIALGGTGEARTISLTPVAGAIGSTTIRIQVDDRSISSSVQFTFMVTNSLPVAVDDEISGVAGVPVRIAIGQILANDTDADGDGLALASFSPIGSAGGTVTRNGNELVVTSGTNVAQESFTYVVEDGSGGTATGRVTVRYVAQPRITGMTVKDGVVRLSLEGIPGAQFEISASTNGATFEVIGNGRADGSGRGEYTDRSTLQLLKLYRVRWITP